MDCLAAAYSSSVRTVFNSRYSVDQEDFVSSKASDKPPQPTYPERISCSFGVAKRFSSSHFFNSWIAMRFARNFSLAVPSPKCSSVIRYWLRLSWGISGCRSNPLTLPAGFFCAHAGARSSRTSSGSFSKGLSSGFIPVNPSSCSCAISCAGAGSSLSFSAGFSDGFLYTFR